MDFRDDGTIGLDFSGQVVTFRPPKLGGYRRLRKLLYAAPAAEQAMVDALPDDMPDADKSNEQVAFREELCLSWWRLILVGDDSFIRLTDDEVPAEDYWPIECAIISNIPAVLGHWVAHPLHSSEQPSPPTNEQPPSDGPSPETGETS